LPGSIRALTISGSPSSASYNTAALRAAAQAAPEDMDIEIVTLHGIPNFDADLERDEGAPAAVQRLKTAIAAADALLIATPEYNRPIPGVLKDAPDWASRDSSESPLRGKPAAILGAGARLGTLTAQAHLRQILQHGHMRVVPQPEVMIDRAETRFDDARSLADERSRDQIRRLLEALAEEVRRGG
jgi:chromate reductase